MIPQGAMNSLNPVVRVKDQILLTMRTHGRLGSERAMRGEIEELLDFGWFASERRRPLSTRIKWWHEATCLYRNCHLDETRSHYCR